jgi:hypothetical protein
MEFNGGTSFNCENPLHIDNIPVANLVVIEVEGHPVLQQENKRVCDTCVKTWDCLQLVATILMLIGILGGFFTFLIWLDDPHILGPTDDN